MIIKYLTFILLIFINTGYTQNTLNNNSKLIKDELIINNVTLISAERKRPLKNAYVRIQNNRIIEVSASEIKPEYQAKVIDGTGQYLIPGLMDSHVHLSFMPGIEFDQSGPLAKLQPLQTAYEKQQPRSYLYHGFTQVLDPALPPQTKQVFNQQPIKPDLFYCGASPILGGYPTVFSESEQRSIEFFPYFVSQKVAGRTPPAGIDMKLHTAEMSIQRMKQDGAICNKIHIEDGFGSVSDWPMLSKDNMNKLRDTAHHNGLKIMAHANALDMQKIAEQMNVDIIAHGLWNWLEFDGEQQMPLEIKALLDRIIKKKIAFQATTGVMVGLRDATAGISVRAEQYSNVTPKKILDYYMSEPGRWFQRQMIAGFDGMSAERIYQQQNSISQQGDKVLKYLSDNDAFLILASDTPASPVYVSQPGLNSYLEMEHMAKVGVPLNKLFESATINNARAFNLEQNYGTIEPGKIANLLLLKANPLKTVTAYNQISHIILGGKIIDRESLKAN